MASTLRFSVTTAKAKDKPFSVGIQRHGTRSRPVVSQLGAAGAAEVPAARVLLQGSVVPGGSKERTMKYTARLWVASLVSGLAGCALNPVTGHRETGLV